MSAPVPTSVSAPVKGHVITANDLKGGGVVYQTHDDCWTPLLARAEVLTENGPLDVGLTRAQAAEDDQQVIGPYAIVVIVTEDDIRPQRYRERLRASGPSTHPEFSIDQDQLPHQAVLSR